LEPKLIITAMHGQQHIKICTHHIHSFISISWIDKRDLHKILYRRIL